MIAATIDVIAVAAEQQHVPIAVAPAEGTWRTGGWVCGGCGEALLATPTDVSAAGAASCPAPAQLLQAAHVLPGMGVRHAGEWEEPLRRVLAVGSPVDDRLGMVLERESGDGLLYERMRTGDLVDVPFGGPARPPVTHEKAEKLLRERDVVWAALEGQAPQLPPGHVGGGGYDWMAVAERTGWHAIGVWGCDGWDLGAWPYVIVLRWTGDGAWGVASYCEGEWSWRCSTARRRPTDAWTGTPSFIGVRGVMAHRIYLRGEGFGPGIVGRIEQGCGPESGAHRPGRQTNIIYLYTCL
ncbi:hypothetical protein ACQEVF_57695 [Nonomuraea polychroma]|uniref:hypothetical protein n=1 Tax=Nonomuraea polychroma TaxID=46176 RepID=UPI003D906B21